MVDKDVLEQRFLSLAEAEGISDVEELNAILDRAVELKEMMKSPDRIEKIAKFVAGHFLKNVEPMGFKAFLVAVDREACALYKRALDKYLPADYSRVIFSPSHGDREELKSLYISAEEEKAIRKSFTRKTEKPKILIVTEKLLTGFDAPILYCMYLDKPMRDHVLLQAIARVNRPYEDDEGQVKPYGFVLDFVGIFEKLERALSFDSDVVASVIQNIDVLKQLFAKMIEGQAQEYLPYAKGWDDKAKERAIAHFEDKEGRSNFFRFFRQLQNVYEVISPDAFLRPFMEQYLALAELFALIRTAYSDRIYVDREVSNKTRELLQQNTVTGQLDIPGAVYTLGAEELEKLKQSDTSDTTKILNLRKVLNAAVADLGLKQPFLLSIGDRAERLAEAYEDRQLTTQQALLEFEKLAQEATEADAERQRLGLDENTFGIYKAVAIVSSGFNGEQSKALNSRNYKSRGEIVRSELGHRAAGDITPQELDQWLTRHCKTAATFNRYRAFLSLCFKQAMANGKVQSNPARLVRQRKEENARLRFLSREEYDRLSNAIRKSYPDQLPAFVVSVNTGMRLTEQYTIEWNQVDLKGRTIRLNKTKNGSARTVHLNSDALAVLEPLQGRGHKATDRVFPSDTADFKTSEWFGECLKAAAVTGYTWHCNRHTACSWLAMAGGTMKEIQEMGGFKTIVMAARYAHLSPDHRLSIVERISSKYAKEQAALQGQQ